jgi:hypothetical protein
MVNFIVSDSLKSSQINSLISLILSRLLLEQQDQARFDILLTVFFEHLPQKPQLERVTDEVVEKFINFDASDKSDDVVLYRNLIQMVI